MTVVGAGGLAELYALGRLHPVNRVAALEERVDRIARALVYAYRGHRRIRLNGPDGDEIAFSDHEGEYVFTSESGRVLLSLGTDHPTRTNVVDFDAEPSCEVRGPCEEGEFCPTDCWGEWSVVDPETCEVTATKYVPLYTKVVLPTNGCGDTAPTPSSSGG